MNRRTHYPAVTLGLVLGRRITVNRAPVYIVAQMLGSLCGAGLVNPLQEIPFHDRKGGTNFVNPAFSIRTGLAAEINGTFVLVYVVYTATDAKRSARDSHVPVLVPLPIGLAVYVVHLSTIPVTGTGINPARSCFVGSQACLGRSSM
ncbi:hypothetical protein Mapa_001631 [Marchantia paleacea]|nr:hypothetical protein Mapa_001631 [Marchantia paleacea]